jgi:hypothetical protein
LKRGTLPVQAGVDDDRVFGVVAEGTSSSFGGLNVYLTFDNLSSAGLLISLHYIHFSLSSLAQATIAN